MNVLSLFDGISVGQVALNKAAIPVSNYFTSEIDKFALAVTKHKWPRTIEMGDVVNLNYENGFLFNPHFPRGINVQVDLLLAGSPCQGFSVAGSQLGLDDPRSRLYFEFERLLKTIKPKYWLLENVLMRQEWADIISNRLGVDPFIIDSALVSGQTRRRMYWTNIPNVTFPTDRGIGLTSIVKVKTDTKKAWALDVNYYKTASIAGMLKMHFLYNRRQLVFEPCKSRRVGPDELDVIQKALQLKENTHKCLGQAKRQVEILKSLKKGELRPRKLTPVECELLQTLPRNYTQFGRFGKATKQLSNSRRYQLLGNAWTADVIAHILSFIDIAF